MATLKWKIKGEWQDLYSGTIGTKLSKANNLSDLANVEDARTNLGLTGDNNRTHYHDDRYVPMIEKQGNRIDTIIKNLSISFKSPHGVNKYIYNPEEGFSVNIDDLQVSQVQARDLDAGRVKVTGMKENDTTVYKTEMEYDKEARTLFVDQATVGKINSTTITGSTITGDKVYGAVWNDYAEFFPRSKKDKIEPGDVVMLDMTTDKECYCKALEHGPVVGVCTDEAAMIIGGEKPLNNEDFFCYNIDKYVPIALAGRVHVNVIGMAKKGDKLVASEQAGCARVFRSEYDRPEDIIGILVEGTYGIAEKRRLRMKVI